MSDTDRLRKLNETLPALEAALEAEPGDQALADTVAAMQAERDALARPARVSRGTGEASV